ncbi:hypothetical protein [Nocardioides dilutus]
MRAPLTLAGLALLAAGTAAPTYAEAVAAAEECQGKPATIVQSEGTVTGTDGNDVIVGGRETKVRAGAGDDTVCVTGGRVEGGDGHDSAEMRGGEGADFIDLRNVEDVDVDTGGGPDHVRLEHNERYGGSAGAVDEGDGLDILSVVMTRSGTNIYLPRGFVESVGGITATAGVENVFASGRWVRIYGNRADNKLWADGCRITMIGGDGDDVLRVVEDHWITKNCHDRQQWLRGRGGDDRLFGGRLGDILQGGSGADTAVGNRGVDRCQAERERSCER